MYILRLYSCLSKRPKKAKSPNGQEHFLSCCLGFDAELCKALWAGGFKETNAFTCLWSDRSHCGVHLTSLLLREILRAWNWSRTFLYSYATNKEDGKNSFCYGWLFFVKTVQEMWEVWEKWLPMSHHFHFCKIKANCERDQHCKMELFSTALLEYYIRILRDILLPKSPRQHGNVG